MYSSYMHIIYLHHTIRYYIPFVIPHSSHLLPPEIPLILPEAQPF